MKAKNSKSQGPISQETSPVRESKWERQLDARLVPVAWFVLLFTGLTHMLPAQMETILKISLVGISLQNIIGTIAVLLALNFLFRE